MLIVIDYDAGNTANVLRALEKIGVRAELSADPEKILSATGLILPGVGAYPAAMAELEKRGLVSVIKEAVAKGTPLLGICLGMQILTEKGLEHEETMGLGFIPGVCRAIPASKDRPVPHMGWNTIRPVKENPLLTGLNDHSKFYFLHSYYFITENPADTICTTDYGLTFTSAVNHRNVYGIQFHPEKSHSNGIRVLQNFATLQ